ncbi:MAG: MFS transporter [Clostridia bacterium]|nr:MFS transporter [Clostridia bacterium]MBQ4157492.1 MFS transporter [Clostridia bacterium]
MNKRHSILNIWDTFFKAGGVKAFLLTILITGLSYGFYKGMLDNFLAEVVHMGEMDRGVTEFFREIPGILLVFILAAFYTLSAETMYKAGAVIMLAGMGMHAVLPPTKVLATLAICMYSLGEHIQLGMKSTLTLKYAKPGLGGSALGVQSAISQIGTLFGYLVIVAAFSYFVENQPYSVFFVLAALLAGASAVLSMRITGRSESSETKQRFYFRKKYSKYYMLEMFYGARKQVFLTFGPYVLILFYGANAATISLLFAISAVACFFASPIVGKIIDRVGYKAVMVTDTLVLVIVCLFYGFAHHVFPRNIAFIVCCVNYVLDAVISLASMAANLYVKDLSDNSDEVKATISTGVSINHVITIFIALFGGWIWQSLGIELLFICSAVLGLLNSAYAMTIRPGRKRV